MLAKLKADSDAIMERDPAAGSRLTAIFIYPSLQVMLAYRLSHPMWAVGMRFIPRLIMQIARWLTGIEIHPGAKIRKGFFVDHGMGVVIGETAEIGENVTLYHGVTLGGVMPAIDAVSQRCVKRHPTLLDDVIVGAGAQILGPVTVGRCARVGGNSVVTKDVADGVTVVGVPAKVVSRAKSDASFEAYGVSKIADDADSKAVNALFAEIELLRAKLNQIAGKDASVIDPHTPASTSHEPPHIDK
ncbi:MAG: serine O-acetyltransferase EpsC [Candidatus Puniceispirillaceae bacterium]